MAKTLTLTLDDAVYEGMRARVSEELQNEFFNELLKSRFLPHPAQAEIEASLCQQAADEAEMMEKDGGLYRDDYVYDYEPRRDLVGRL